MYAQILQIGLGDHLADGIGHGADTQLQAGTVGNLRHHQLGHGHIHIGGLTAAAQLVHDRVVAFHDHIHVTDMDTVVKTAQADGDIFVDLHDDLLGHLAHSLQVRAAGAEVKPAVLVHGGHLEHGHIHGLDAVAVVAGQLGIPQGDVIRESLLDGLALHAAHMPGIPGKVLSCVGNIKNGGTVGQNAAADIDVLQALHPLGQRLVQRHRGADAPTVVQPHAGVHTFDGLLCRGQLLLVFLLIAHDTSSC